VLRGDMPVVHWTDPSSPETMFLDVRDPDEFEEGHLPGAINIPVNMLRSQLDRVSGSKDLRIYCAVGQRGYLATRILAQHGVVGRNLSGGFASRCSP